MHLIFGIICLYNIIRENDHLKIMDSQSEIGSIKSKFKYDQQYEQNNISIEENNSNINSTSFISKYIIKRINNVPTNQSNAIGFYVIIKNGYTIKKMGNFGISMYDNNSNYLNFYLNSKINASTIYVGENKQPGNIPNDTQIFGNSEPETIIEKYENGSSPLFTFSYPLKNANEIELSYYIKTGEPFNSSTINVLDNNDGKLIITGEVKNMDNMEKMNVKIFIDEKEYVPEKKELGEKFTYDINTNNFTGGKHDLIIRFLNDKGYVFSQNEQTFNISQDKSNLALYITIGVVTITAIIVIVIVVLIKKK